MRKIVVVEWMTLDGVAQAPGHPDEDRDGVMEGRVTSTGAVLATYATTP